jgi:hypothetical protein
MCADCKRDEDTFPKCEKKKANDQYTIGDNTPELDIAEKSD